ncbi:MAG: AraC family transcriptional regulator [Nannocystales bacterium]
MTAVLRHLRIRDPLFGRIELREPWGGPSSPDADLLLHHVVEGTAYLHLDGPPVEIRAGGVVLLAGCAHALSHGPGRPGPETRFWDGPSESVGPSAVRRRLGGSGSQTVILCASASLEGAASRLLLSSLPPVVHVECASELPGFALVLDCIRDEVSSNRAGAPAMLARYAEMLLLLVVRANTSPTRGWTAALADVGLGRALAALYEDPARSWTVVELARTAGMSRSRFSECFRDQVGESPIRHLTRWRMALAQDLLAAGSRVGAVAACVGYSDEAAFSNAFRREVGVSPGQFRDTARSVSNPP